VSAVKGKATRAAIRYAFHRLSEFPHELAWVTVAELRSLADTAAGMTHFRKELRDMVARGEAERRENVPDLQRGDLAPGRAVYRRVAPPATLHIYRTGGTLVTLCRSCMEGWPDDEPLEQLESSPVGSCSECGRSA
jgi:hypothetical protein